jgi:hypothetical protein
MLYININKMNHVNLTIDVNLPDEYLGIYTCSNDDTFDRLTTFVKQANGVIKHVIDTPFTRY